MRSDYTYMNRLIAGFSEAVSQDEAGSSDRQPVQLESLEVVDLPDEVAAGLQLRETLERRESSLSYGREGISVLNQLVALRDALRRDAEAWGETARKLPLEGFVFAFRSTDLLPAIYRVDIRGAARVSALPPEDEWEDLGLQKEFARAAAIVSVAANLDRAEAWGGANGYRNVMTRSAGVIYDFHLDSISHQLVGTVFAGFIPAAVRWLLKSDGVCRQQMFATTVAQPALQVAGGGS